MNKIIAITLFTVASCMEGNQREEYLAMQREKFNRVRQQAAQNINNESNQEPNLIRNDSININAMNDVLDRSHSDQPENQNNAVNNVQSHEQLINEEIVNIDDNQMNVNNQIPNSAGQDQQPQNIPPINEGVYREGMLFDNNQIHFNNADHSDNIYNVNEDHEQDNMDDELQRAIQDSLSINNPNHIINDQNVHNVHNQINQNDESERVRNFNDPDYLDFNNPDYLDFNNPDYLASDVAYQRILEESANVNNVHNVNNVQDVNNAHNQNNQEEQDLERALLESLNHDNDVDADNHDVQLQQALLESNLNNAHGSANLNNAHGSDNLNNAYGSDNLNNAIYVSEDDDLDLQKAIEESTRSNLFNFR